MSATEILKSQELEETLEGWKGTRAWLVEATTGGAAQADDDVDQAGDAYIAMPTVICKRRRIAWKSLNYYIVTCHYDDRTDSDTAHHEIGDTTEKWDMHTRTEKAVVDLSGNPIGQDGEGVDVLVPHVRLSLSTWVRNRSDYSPFYDLVAKVNSATFKGVAAGKWLCMGIAIEEVTSSMLKVDYLFEMDVSDSGWQYEWYPYSMQDVTVDGEQVKQKVYRTPAQTSTIYTPASFAGVWP